jgi:hypothetical protein
LVTLKRSLKKEDKKDPKFHQAVSRLSKNLIAFWSGKGEGRPRLGIRVTK